MQEGGVPFAEGDMFWGEGSRSGNVCARQLAEVVDNGDGEDVGVVNHGFWGIGV